MPDGLQDNPDLVSKWEPKVLGEMNTFFNRSQLERMGWQKMVGAKTGK